MDAQFNRFELEAFARSAADAYHDGGVELNDTITKQAQENGFTRHHVQRVAENANILVNGELVKSARANGDDPRVAFPLADAAQVWNRVSGGEEREKVAEARGLAEVFDLFSVKSTSVDGSRVIDGVLGPMAPDPYADHAVSRDHVELAGQFVKSAELADERAKDTDAATLSLVSQTLDGLAGRARTDSEVAKVAMEQAQNDLVAEITSQIMSEGLSPATIRDVIKSASLDGEVAAVCDQMVTKAAALCDVREGRSEFGDGAVVNTNHPLIVKAAGLMNDVESAVHAGMGAETFSDAARRARDAYARAVREGR